MMGKKFLKIALIYLKPLLLTPLSLFIFTKGELLIMKRLLIWFMLVIAYK